MVQIIVSCVHMETCLGAYEKLGSYRLEQSPWQSKPAKTVVNIMYPEHFQCNHSRTVLTWQTLRSEGSSPFSEVVACSKSCGLSDSGKFIRLMPFPVGALLVGISTASDGMAVISASCLKEGYHPDVAPFVQRSYLRRLTYDSTFRSTLKFETRNPKGSVHWFAYTCDIEHLMSRLEALYPDIELSDHIPLVPAAMCGSNFQGPVEFSKIALA